MKITLSFQLKCEIHRGHNDQGYYYEAKCPSLGIAANGAKEGEAKDNLQDVLQNVLDADQEGLTSENTRGFQAMVALNNGEVVPSNAIDESYEESNDKNEYWSEQSIYIDLGD